MMSFVTKPGAMRPEPPEDTDTGDEERRRRERSDRRMARLGSQVFVCNGGRCQRLGADGLLRRFRAEAAKRDEDRLRVTETRCTGRCVDSCSVVVYPDGVWYRNVTEVAVPAIVARHTGGDHGVDSLVSFFYQDGRFVKNQ